MHIKLLLCLHVTRGMQELDEAARRRLPKQLYIPLPCARARRTMLDRELGALPDRTPFLCCCPPPLSPTLLHPPALTPSSREARTQCMTCWGASNRGRKLGGYIQCTCTHCTFDQCWFNCRRKIWHRGVAIGGGARQGKQKAEGRTWPRPQAKHWHGCVQLQHCVIGV